MSREVISPFCPKDCVFLDETEEIFHRGCGHLEDITVEPAIPAETKTKPVKKVKVVGADPSNFYVEDTMTNGNKSIFKILKEGILLRRK